MDVPLRHLNALRAFEAAARHSSFAKAAEELHVSHSVISQHVKTLEGWLGTQLFIRHGNRIELTEEARTLTPHLSNAFQTLRDACYSVLKLNQRGALTILAEPAIASRWLRRQTNEFCAEFPNVEIDVKSAWTAPQFGEGQADMLVHFDTRRPKSGAMHRKLFPLDCFPACAPDLKKKLLSKDNKLDFDHMPLVHDNGRQIWQLWYAEHVSAGDGWQTGKVYSDLSMAIDAAIDGEGVILADNIICQRELQMGTLVPLDKRVARCVWYTASVPKDSSSNSAVIALLSWLEKSANAESGSSD
ncbi:LysR family transcriptional regulator [uncultured Ruegeria sp.]|uniref:LysR family transcriptional regulator n=1 Tax=uncultured Ruegeria sp. TaxID=259304 RepID=UPI0026159832|nr:LysR family transcriptional regulator [uncultured Ruegeria sp.]